MNGVNGSKIRVTYLQRRKREREKIKLARIVPASSNGPDPMKVR